jgi:osmotically-inducible protein OsmY
VSVVLPAHVMDHPSEHLVQDLATAVEGRLWRYDPLRQTGSLVAVRTADGGVTLEGNVRSDTIKAVATRLARTVPGVRAVDNRLVSDSEVEIGVAVVLAMDPEVELYTDRVTVKSLLGEVYLGGQAVAPELATAERARDLAAERAAAVPGVRQVINEIRAVEGTEAGVVAAAADEPAATGGLSAAQQAIQERLAVWRERAAAR